MPKRTFQERRKETNHRYYENRKAQQGQQTEDSQDNDGSDIWL